MPADRLASVASKILVAQPEPPRRVSFTDVWTINWPLLLYIVVPGLIVNVIVSFVPHLPIAIRALAILLPVTSLAIWAVLVILPQVAALRRGILDSGAVVVIEAQPRGGYRGRVQLQGRRGVEASTFYYLTAHRVKVGDRLRVLVDPSSGKVMTTLGVQAPPG